MSADAELHALGHYDKDMNPSPSKPLTRSHDDAMLGGVCGGLAQWLGWDATLLRVIYVAVSFFSAAFPGIIVYILLWVIMPREE